MKIGDKILIKATNQIATIEAFQNTGDKKSFLYVRVSPQDRLKTLFMYDFYLLVEPTKSSNPSHSDFMNFLDDNPQNEVQETTEPTEEQKIAWQAELDEHNRMIADQNTYYNS